MNILVPDSWLREFLKTNAKPADTARCLSLCGPSIQKTTKVGADYVYEVEVTTNRVDSLSVYGVAREAAAILPEFGFRASLLGFPNKPLPSSSKPLGITITNDPKLCRRILAVKLENVHLGPSPAWLAKRLELVGQRPLNNIIDITNYVMWETGHPMHAFDYDRLINKQIIVRLAKKEENLITLDGKKHTMVGGEIIFDDGNGEIIDLPGIMGTANTVVNSKTRNILLFIENSDPTKIRFASMTHAIRSQAAVINEKDPDPELALVAMKRGIALATEVANATVASKLIDIYPTKPKSKQITLSQEQLEKYIATKIPQRRVTRILSTLGFSVEYKTGSYIVAPPSWRLSDVTIPEDIIEEIARIYGYHNIASTLPNTAPPETLRDESLEWDEQIKIRLRDWGYTETYTYSMISEELMDKYNLNKSKAYKITNPLSREWVYMRPSLVPSIEEIIKQNISFKSDLRVFELSMVYQYRAGDLPRELPSLVVAWTENRYAEAKGLAEAIFDLLGTVDPSMEISASPTLTILTLDIATLIKNAKPTKQYRPPPKYPPIYEDFTFVVPPKTQIGLMIEALRSAHRLIADVSLLDTYEDTRTFHIAYQSREKNLTDKDIKPAREKLIKIASDSFGANIKA